MKPEDIQENLLTPLWRGIAPEYKVKYALSIWTQFEDNIRSAAYTSSASDFLSRIKTRMGITIFADDAEKIATIINSGEDRRLLKSLRDDTTLLVLLCRVANEERREEMKRQKEAKQAQQMPIIAA